MVLDYKSILYFLFPLSGDEQVLDDVTPADFLHKLNPLKTLESISLLPYSDMQVRSAIHLVKFHNHPHARLLLSSILVLYLQQTMPLDTVLIPVPLSSKRKRQRGYNQVTEIIATAKMSANLIENILVRTRNTTPQTKLKREERLVNMRNAFSIRNKSSTLKKLAGKHIVLIDDVTTTGATFKAAKAALLPLHPASITCVALAH